MGKLEFLADIANPSGIDHPKASVHTASAASGYAVSNKDAGLKIEHFSNDEDLDFQISSKKEILTILKNIAEQGTRVALYFGNNRNFVLTTLLGANEDGMWLDVGPFAPENKQLLLSDQFTFVSTHQHVKIQFVACEVKSDLFENHQAFYLELPDCLLRIQRREFFRSAIPSAPPVKCIIPIPPENPDDRVIIREVPLVDISGGGVRLLCEGRDATLLPNRTFQDCRISLPEVGTLTVTIEVRSSINFTTPKNGVYKRVGCRFVHLDNQMNILLQRHIARLQSESMAKRRMAVIC